MLALYLQPQRRAQKIQRRGPCRPASVVFRSEAYSLGAGCGPGGRKTAGQPLIFGSAL